MDPSTRELLQLVLDEIRGMRSDVQRLTGTTERPEGTIPLREEGNT